MLKLSLKGLLKEGKYNRFFVRMYHLLQVTKYLRKRKKIFILSILIFSKIKEIVVFAVDILLDPATAHPNLNLSEGNGSITWGEKQQDLSDDSQRFYSFPCVLGHQVIASAKYYWEVEVKDSRKWDLGICRNNVTRKEKIYIKPEDGFWAIRFYNDECWALTSPETQLSLKVCPERMCIFLEFEDGRVLFYNMTDKSHMHTFSQGSFDRSVRTFFRVWSSDLGHLTICPVSEEALLDNFS